MCHKPFVDEKKVSMMFMGNLNESPSDNIAIIEPSSPSSSEEQSFISALEQKENSDSEDVASSSLSRKRPRRNEGGKNSFINFINNKYPKIKNINKLSDKKLNKLRDEYLKDNTKLDKKIKNVVMNLRLNK